MVDVNSVKRKLEVALKLYFKQEGYDNSEIKESSLYTIDHEHNKDEKYTDFYIYAEIPVEEFFVVSDVWNEVMEKFDPSSYFDVLSPGIYMARVYWDSAVEDQAYELEKSDLENFGESVADALTSIYDEDFWVDSIRYNKTKDVMTIKVSSKNYIAKISQGMELSGLSSYNEFETTYLDVVVELLESEMKEL